MSTAAGNWWERANCRGVDTRLFFPDTGMDTSPAKQVCQGCEVREECLRFALTNQIRVGVWGGMSERQRRGVRREWVASTPVPCKVCDGEFRPARAGALYCSEACRSRSRRKRGAA